MVYELPNIYYFICEGASEVAYLKQWNQLLREAGAHCSFHAESAGGCRPALFSRAFRQRSWKRNEMTYLLMDNDCYCPEVKKALPKCRVLVNIQNFEDFLSLHLPFEQAAEWCRICVGRNHFSVPMCASEYVPLFQQIVPGYVKNRLPTNFLTPESLNHLQANYENPRLHPKDTSNRKDTFAQFLIDHVFPALGRG